MNKGYNPRTGSAPNLPYHTCSLIIIIYLYICARECFRPKRRRFGNFVFRLSSMTSNSLFSSHSKIKKMNRRPWRHNITLQLSLLILTNEEKGRCNIWPADDSRIWKSRVPIYQDTMFSSHFNNKPSCMKRKRDNVRPARHYIIIIITFIEKYQQRKKWKPHDVITHKTHIFCKLFI